jgi:uncharacterized membrane protein
MAILARQLLPEAELSATALVATSPFLIYFSQENRNYSLFILLTLLSTWALFRFKESGRCLALYSALSILLLYTHYLGIFVLLAHEIVYWWHLRQRVRGWILARVVLVVAFAPWLFWAAERSRSESRLFLSPAWLIPTAFLRFFLGYGVYVFDASQNVESIRSKLIGEAPCESMLKVFNRGQTPAFRAFNMQ